jgi:hypothetical protein
MSTLESILSGEGAPASEPQATTTTATPETTQEQPQGQSETSSNDEPQADERGTIPIAALHAERNKVKRYTEQVAEFQAKLEQQNAQWEQRFTQMISATQPKQAPPAPVAELEVWDDPNAFVRTRAMEMVSPLQQQMQAMARQVAEIQFRDQPGILKEAEEAFNRAAATGQIDPEIHRRINSSPNPFAAAVQWHQHTNTMSEIGSDPAAYKAKLAEEIRAQVMAELQAGDAPAGQQAAPVMPSNFAAARNVGSRAGPAWAGPQPIQSIFDTARK